MLFIIFDAAGILRCVTDKWPVARSALDVVVQEDCGCPRLEVCQDSYFAEKEG